VTAYEYGNLCRRTGETWLDESSVVVSQFEFGYDLAGQLLSAGDGNTNYVYAYDGLGRLVESAHDYSGFAPSVMFAYGYGKGLALIYKLCKIKARKQVKHPVLVHSLARRTRIEMPKIR